MTATIRSGRAAATIVARRSGTRIAMGNRPVSPPAGAQGEQGVPGVGSGGFGLPSGGTDGFPVLKAGAVDGNVSFGGRDMDMDGYDINNVGDVNAERLQLTTENYQYLVLSVNNNHPTPTSSFFQYSFGGVRMFAFGVSNSAEEFQVTTYDSSAAWKGSPFIIERSTGGGMNNILRIATNRSVAIDGDLAVGGPLGLKSYTVMTAPTASAAGAGAQIYLTNGDAGTACTAVSDGTNWRVIALGATASSS